MLQQVAEAGARHWYPKRARSPPSYWQCGRRDLPPQGGHLSVRPPRPPPKTGPSLEPTAPKPSPTHCHLEPRFLQHLWGSGEGLPALPFLASLSHPPPLEQLCGDSPSFSPKAMTAFIIYLTLSCQEHPLVASSQNKSQRCPQEALEDNLEE